MKATINDKVTEILKQKIDNFTYRLILICIYNNIIHVQAVLHACILFCPILHSILIKKRYYQLWLLFEINIFKKIIGRRRSYYSRQKFKISIENKHFELSILNNTLSNITSLYM